MIDLNSFASRTTKCVKHRYCTITSNNEYAEGDFFYYVLFSIPDIWWGLILRTFFFLIDCKFSRFIYYFNIGDIFRTYDKQLFFKCLRHKPKLFVLLFFLKSIKQDAMS